MLTRRSALTAAAAGLSSPALAQGAARNVLRFVPHANLSTNDPIGTTGNITRNHGYMVYDTLYGADAALTPSPQMAAGHVVEDDGRRWTITLREGLKFHDGERVLAKDAVASLKRWMKRSPWGGKLEPVLDELSAADDRRIVFRLKRPFPTLPDTLAKPDVSPLFIMPERLAATDPYTQIREAVGSGPFRFVQNEWNPGQRAVWAKFDGYVPRDDAPSGTAGRKAPLVDRVEWTIIPDSSTAAAALANGEHDYWEYPLHDLLPTLRRNSGVVVGQRLSQGTYACCRFNQLHPPFDNAAIRRAVLMAVDQRDYMRAVVGDTPGSWEECPSYFTCGTPVSVSSGSDTLKVRSLDRAKAALQAAGYKGEKVVLLAPSDYPQINAVSLVTADLLQRMGFNLELVATDWGTMVQRRANREPVDKGGWSVIHTTWTGGSTLNPALNQFARTNGERAWFGWPSDDEIEKLRDSWFDADAAEQVRIADRIQARAFEVVPYVPLGFYWQPSAWRNTLTGVEKNHVTSFWNIGKA
jgi:peptide/nickel transport system substrate-binding protein